VSYAHVPYILVCDDEAPIRKVIASRLKGAGFQVREARNGEEGIALARECSPVLILTDCQMPLVNGLEMCRAIRNELKITVPALLLTARGYLLTPDDLKSANIQAVLPKPFGVRDLLERVMGLINRDIETSSVA
jgi:DNA-binding response OmpR family regulator